MVRPAEASFKRSEHLAAVLDRVGRKKRSFDGKGGLGWEQKVQRRPFLEPQSQIQEPSCKFDSGQLPRIFF